MTGVIIGMSRAIGETAPIITIGALTFIAFLPPSPVTPAVVTMPVRSESQRQRLRGRGRYRCEW